jgi:MFS family permease
MELYKKINNVAGWLVLLFATVVYALTLESSGSFWDCGEFVPCCFKLEVPHSPGAPLFVLIGRMFTFLAMGDTTKVAIMVNFMSGLSTAFAMMFVYWSITHLASKVFFKNKETDYTMPNIIAVVGSGIIGAACATFLDSMWFSAVEGEVYALSQFFMGFIVWAILKWDSIDDTEDKYADRWLLLIAYMVGLSIGVHLLSLLALPFIALIYYYKRYKQSSILGFILASFAGFAILGFAMKFMISYTQGFLGSMDKLFVNSFHMPFWSGAFVAMIILVSILAGGIYYTQYVNKKGFWNFGFLCAAFMYVGYLSYALIPIRASINPPIDMGRPTDPFGIKAYVDRDQYGDRPLVWGPDYTAIGARVENGGDIEDTKVTGEKFYRSKDSYKSGGMKYDYVFKSDACMFFPRLGFWQEEQKKSGYRVWLTPGSKMLDRKSGFQVVKEFDSGQQEQANEEVKQRNAQEPGRYMLKDNIGFGDNIRFFVKYQLGYMFLRYFMWNFAGRQDDIQGTYANDNGRWICGIPFIDNLGGAFFTPEFPQDNLPKSVASNKGRNKFYMIPFLLGLIGFIYTLYKNEKIFISVFVLFMVTGIFQLIYSNEPPIEPRERDYALAGSFWTYCIWIGFGIMAIIEFLRKKIQNMDMPIVAGVLILCLSAPYLMGSQGWDDHSRHARYTTRDFAKDYLESCAPNALLFTQGDNDTYPLWYAQEVEGIRPDVRVINLSLIGVDWYIEQLKYKWNNSAPVKISFRDDQIEGNNRDIVRYSASAGVPEGASVELKKVMKFIASDDSKDKLASGQGEFENYLPAKNVFIEVDSNKVRALNMVDPRDMDKVVPRMQWTIGGQLLKNDLLTLDMVANNIMDRPIYFAVSVAPDAYEGLEKYFQLEGMAYRVVPIENPGRNAQSCPVRADSCYVNMMQKFGFGGIKENPNIYLDENILRMTMNLRGNYARLAQALMDKGQNDMAIKVLDHSLQEMPKDRVPYNYFVAMYPDLYFKAGAPEKAKKLSQELWAEAKDDLKYYQYVFNTKLKRAKESGSVGEAGQLERGIFIQNRQVQEPLIMMQEVVQAAKANKQPEYPALVKEFRDYQASFVPAQAQQIRDQPLE